MNIKKVGGAVLVLGGLFAYSQYQDVRHLAAVAKEFKLTQAQTTVLKGCDASLTRHARQFKGGLDRTRGCACLAGRMTQNLPTNQYPAAVAVIDFLVERSKSNQRGGVAEWISKDPVVSQLGSAETFKLFGAASVSMGYCRKMPNRAQSAVASLRVLEYKPPSQ